MVSRITDKPIIIRRSSHLARSRSLSRSPSRHREIKTISTKLDNSLPLPFLAEDVLGLVSKLGIAHWRSAARRNSHIPPLGLVRITRISGALTNAVYKVEYIGPKGTSAPQSSLQSVLQSEAQNGAQHAVSQTAPQSTTTQGNATQSALPLTSSHTPHPLLLRVYGVNVSHVVDREKELSILSRLLRHNIGPRLLGCFGNGRFEQWLEDTAPLTASSMRERRVSCAIARRMRALHSGVQLTPTELASGPAVWLCIDKWLRLVGQYFAKTASPELEEKILLSSFKKFAEAVRSYRLWMDSQPAEPLVFCHNDTQYGNLLLRGKGPLEDDSRLVVIDFEYAAPNPAAYDIADHFCEWMADYHDQEKPWFLEKTRFPSESQQKLFLESYLGPNEDVSSLMALCRRWCGAVNALWCLWGVIQSPEFGQIMGEQKVTLDEYTIIENEADVEGEEEEDPFDYLKYSACKAGLFWDDIKEFGLVPEIRA